MNFHGERPEDQTQGSSDENKGTIPEGGFRCPFHVEGEKKGTILDVPLDENRDSRFEDIAKAFETFHQTPSSPGLRFRLPNSILEHCSSNEELRSAIVPYQSEILAAELEYRLNPFLPYQLRTQTKEKALELFQKEPYKLMSADLLATIMVQCGSNSPENSKDIADWIEEIIKDAMAKGIKNPKLQINDPEAKTGFEELITISPGGVTIHPERSESVTSPKNKNCFGIVTSPFYPKEFGRHSKDVEIIVSRELDFASLSKEARQKIRKASNTVLHRHGVNIIDMEEDKQEGGVWLPEYRD